MDRKEFLTLFGAGAASLLYSACLSGCSTTDNPVSAPANVDFTLDLTNAANSALTKDGGYLYKDGVIVARISAGNIVAVSAACTHQGVSVKYTSNQFYCAAHGSSFSTSGARTGGPAKSALKKYSVTLTGNSLHVTS